MNAQISKNKTYTIDEIKEIYVFQNKEGNLVYHEDEKGNKIPDFSYVGYHSGEKPIPNVPTVITLEPLPGDNTKYIQKAIDKLGQFSLDKNGFRGAVLLKKGVYKVNGSLSLSKSGIVLRGEGNSDHGTIIVATGYDDIKFRRSLISIGPNSNFFSREYKYAEIAESGVFLNEQSGKTIVDEYVPIGAKSFKVISSSSYNIGDRIIVFRPSTLEWISSIGCDNLKPKWEPIKIIRWVKKGNNQGLYYLRSEGSTSEYKILKNKNESWEEFKNRLPFSSDGKKLNITRQWQEGAYDFYFERKIVKIIGDQIFIDIPIVHPIEKKFGGGKIYHFTNPGRVTEVGVENLRLVSEFSRPTKNNPYGDPEKINLAELHAWNGIQIQPNSENIWIKNIIGNYFGWSLVSASGKRATIQDCTNLGHASKITGGRRYSFMINGQLNLVQRCLTNAGRHEFVTQQKTAGPNVFVDCIGYNSKSLSGPHHRYSVGTLFDNVKSEKPMESRFRGNSGTGHGWAGSQICFYNCRAPKFIVESPPGGISWVIRSADNQDRELNPASLYYKQVQERLGNDALTRLIEKKYFDNIGKYKWVKINLNDEKEQTKLFAY